MHQPLLDYIKQARAAGMKDNEIRQALLKVNWKKEYIEEALASCLEPANKKINAKIIIFIVLGLLSTGLIIFIFLDK